jgi:hypothetical protein
MRNLRPASGRCSTAGMSAVDHALAERGRSRHIAAYVAHFLVAPSIVATTDLVVTTGRRIAERVAPMLGLEVLDCPVALDPFVVRSVWHPRTEDDSVGRWLRGVFREASARLARAERTPTRRRTRAARGRGKRAQTSG